jgi:hypothetical protein
MGLFITHRLPSGPIPLLWPRYIYYPHWYLPRYITIVSSIVFLSVSMIFLVVIFHISGKGVMENLPIFLAYALVI